MQTPPRQEAPVRGVQARLLRLQWSGFRAPELDRCCVRES